MKYFVAALMLLITAQHCFSDDLGQGSLPVEYAPKIPLQVNLADMFVVEGNIVGSEAAIVVRLDDGQSRDYASRYNSERALAPGPFTLTVPAADLRTPSGRPLNLADIRRAIVGKVGGLGTVTIVRFEVKRQSTQTSTAPPAPTRAATVLLQIGRGLPPLEYETASALQIEPSDTIVIEGSVTEAEAGIVVRVDDGHSVDYASRVNVERVLLPGKFSVAIPAADLRASSGRALDLKDIRRVVAGSFSGAGKVNIDRFDILRQPVTDATPSVAVATPNANEKRALKIGSGDLPISYEPDALFSRDDDDEIRVEGEVPAGSKVVVVLRVDDRHSKSYATRFNDERSLPPGPFNWSVGLKGLKTPEGRILDHQALQQIILFVLGKDPGVRITRIEIAPAPRLPAGVKGYALGAPEARLPAGFERISPGDRRLDGGQLKAIARPAPDPLVANGIKGVDRLRLEAPQGRARVTVWSEDPGEWEDLPHTLQRRITVNGEVAMSFNFSVSRWVSERYLAGLSDEHASSDDAWTAYGRKRGQARTVEVDVGQNGIVIECDGDDDNSKFLSAVVVEPAGDTAGFEYVESLRAAWYRSSFPVVKDDAAPDPSTSVLLQWAIGQTADTEPIRATAAPDSGVRLRLSVRSDTTLAHPVVAIDEPSLLSHRLPVRLWAAERRLERRGTVLTLAENRLISRLAERSIELAQSRDYEIWVSVPEGTLSGIHRGAIRFENEGNSRTVPIEINVLRVALPPASKAAGFYLATPHQLDYFPQLAIDSDRQSTCDMEFMRAFGLTGTAPPVRSPRHDGAGAFLADMSRALRAGVSPNWLLYDPAKYVLQSEGVDTGAETIARAAQVLKEHEISAPVWTMADEPSNPGSRSADLAEWIGAVRKKAPGIKLAGHLNSRGDEAFVHLFDTAIINDGFGLDVSTIDRLAARGPDVWFYNTGGYPRLTAGLWLWRTAAKRYVQWHGRMPTADPFDPLDGREGDFQMLFPSAEICTREPDIHADLLRMAEGVVDQRWLLWLDKQETPEAKVLQASIRAKLGTTWKKASSLTAAEIASTRADIIALVNLGK